MLRKVLYLGAKEIPVFDLKEDNYYERNHTRGR